MKMRLDAVIFMFLAFPVGQLAQQDGVEDEATNAVSSDTGAMDDNSFCSLFEPNKMVDDILNSSSREITSGSNRSQLRLPKVEWMRLTMIGGNIVGMEHLSREGDAKSTCTEAAMDLEVVVHSSKPLTGIYQWYKPIVIAGINIGGLAQVWIRDMALTVEVTVPLDGEPPRVKQVRPLRLQGLVVKIKGLGPINTLASRLSTYLANAFSAQALTIAEEVMRSEFAKNALQELVNE